MSKPAFAEVLEVLDREAEECQARAKKAAAKASRQAKSISDSSDRIRAFALVISHESASESHPS